MPAPLRGTPPCLPAPDEYPETVRRLPFVLAGPLVVVLSVGLVGCTPPAPTPTESRSPVPTESASPSPSALPTATATGSPAAGTPAADTTLRVALDHTTFEGAAEPLTYARGAKDAWTAALGSEPTESPMENPPGYDFQQTLLTWPGLRLTVPNDGSANGGRLFVSAATVSGHPIRTAQGIGVGSTRSEALATGATEGYDATQLRVDVRDVPGTTSLERPGEVGREFIMLLLEGDTVVSMHVPANDFSDL